MSKPPWVPRISAPRGGLVGRMVDVENTGTAPAQVLRLGRTGAAAH